jgi:sugar phosphate isomerase/epimerase
MELGIFAKTFARPRLEESLDAVRASGFGTIQFNMALAGGSSLPDDIPAALAARIRDAAVARGLRTAAVSGTYNMAHPDAAARAGGARRLAVLIRAAPALGTSVVTLCTGTRDADDMWRRHPANDRPDAWADMLTSVRDAWALAEGEGITLAFEPEHNNVVDSAAAGRRLLDEIRSPNLKVILDPANLFPDGELARQDDTLHEAFGLLGPELVLAHAKDVRPGGEIVAAGQGELDYDLYVALLRESAPEVPLITHGLAEAEVPATLAFLQGAVA